MKTPIIDTEKIFPNREIRIRESFEICDISWAYRHAIGDLKEAFLKAGYSPINFWACISFTGMKFLIYNEEFTGNNIPNYHYVFKIDSWVGDDGQDD